MLGSASFVEALWRNLALDPTTGVMVLTPEGRVLYTNRQAARVFFAQDQSEEHFIGRSASEWMAPDHFQERLSVLQEVHRDGKPRACRGIYAGLQCLSVVHRVEFEDRGETQTALLVIARPVAGEVRGAPSHTHELHEVKSIGLGPLDVLSPRELEVLSLIGDGLSLPEIAEALKRSLHTINDHRKAIGRKLGVDDRVMLARMARDAGLRPEDAARERLRFLPDMGRTRRAATEGV
jgi:DNA-binding CsgD family transcriptional regulator